MAPEAHTYIHLDGPANRSGGTGFRTPRVNSLVSPQDVIGTVGDSGNAKGMDPHAHVQVREGGEFVTPNIQGPVTPLK